MNRKQTYIYLTLILCLLSGLIFFSVSHYLRIKSEDTARDIQRFQKSALQAEVAIQRTITSKLDGLYVMRDAYAVSGQQLSREQFRVLADSVYQRTRGIQALEWIPRVTHGQREAYEEEARKDGLDEFSIKEPDQKGNMIRAGERAEYFPVYYVEPLKGNEKALGFDLASNPARGKTLSKALATGSMVTSSRIRLVQETGSQSGILVFFPQTNGLSLAGSTRKDSLFLAVFRVEDMIVSAFPEGYDPDLHIFIYDFEDTLDLTPLAVLSHDSGINRRLPLETLIEDNPQSISADIRVGDRLWKTVVVPVSPIPIYLNEVMAWFVALLILAVTLTFSAFILSRVRHTIAVRESGNRYRAMSHRLNAILENTRDGIFTMDQEGHIRSFNKAAQGMFGYSHTELLGKSVSMLLPDLDLSQGKRTLAKLVESQEKEKADAANDLKGKRKDGTSFYLRLGISEVPVQNDNFYVGILQDITERKKTEGLKDSFISTVNHELRTPLTSILGGVELLKKLYSEQLPEKAKGLLNIAEKNTRRITRIVDDILDLQKMEAGEMQFNFEPVQLSLLVDTALSENQLYAEQFDVSTVVTTQDEIIFIEADADRIVQVLTNLLSNAIKFSPKGGVVQISSVLDDEQKRVRVSVTDQGPGIPYEFTDKLFERFTQAGSTLTRKGSGTGLGLSISKMIIDRHGGEIGVSVDEEQGTTFYFELNLYQQPAE